MGAAASIHNDEIVLPTAARMTINIDQHIPTITTDTAAVNTELSTMVNAANGTMATIIPRAGSPTTTFTFQEESKAHIHLLPFEHLKLIRTIPSYHDHAHLTVPYPDINRELGVVIFISHVWLRGLEQPPHPDNASWSKYKLLIAGLEKFQQAYLTPEHIMYLWLDYSCINLTADDDHFSSRHPLHHVGHKSSHNSPSHGINNHHNYHNHHNPHSPSQTHSPHKLPPSPSHRVSFIGKPGHKSSPKNSPSNHPHPHSPHDQHEHHDSILHRPRKDPWKDLKDIMSVVDCIFTPMTSLRSYKAMTTYRDYDCPEWHSEGNQFKSCYLNRAWCRLELLYAQTIPLAIDALRSEHWKSILKYQYNLGRRAHFIFGMYELETCVDPILIPQLKPADLEHLHPLRGFTSIPDDKEKIRQLMMLLEPYMKELRLGYEGAYCDGMMHGRGVYRYVNGDVYEGNFHHGKIHGFGKASYADGSSYEGNWDNHQKHGKGTHKSSTGDVYVGQFHYDFKHGRGKITYQNGDVYEGDFTYDKEHGKGKWIFENGDVYEGEVNHGMLHGKGKKVFANGDVYEGYFEDNVFQGVGVYRWSNGDVYEGTYEDGLMHGSVGQLKKANTGDIYTGKWYQGVLHQPTKKENAVSAPSEKKARATSATPNRKSKRQVMRSEAKAKEEADAVMASNLVQEAGESRHSNNQITEAQH